MSENNRQILSGQDLPKLQCRNRKCTRKKEEESSFILHTYHIEEHDYQIDAGGNVGEYITEGKLRRPRLAGIMLERGIK